MEAVDEICDGAHEHGLPVHMDGARIFNAATYLGGAVQRDRGQGGHGDVLPVEGAGRAGGVDGGGAAEAIDRARLYRKRLGGGMRQAGVLAAAGLIALEQMPWRLRRGSRECAVSGGRAVASAGRGDRSGAGADQHSDLRCQRDGLDGRSSARD